MVILWLAGAWTLAASIDLNSVVGAAVAGAFLMANTIITLVVTGRRDRRERQTIREEVDLAERERQAKRTAVGKARRHRTKKEEEVRHRPGGP